MSLHLSDFFNIMAGHIKESYLGQDPEIKDISYDSRFVKPSCLFFCKGHAFKKEYLNMAIEKGALAFIIDEKGLDRFKELPEMPYILVDDIRHVLADSAALFYDYPDKKLDIYAITGTKGKSSTAWYLKALMDYDADKKGLAKTGLISSIATYDGLEMKEARLTTPEPFELFALLDKMHKNGLKRLVMEVSSQALKYERTKNIAFRGAAFLNIAPDHVSPLEHPNFEDYFSSKLSIFKQAERAFINLDSDKSDEIIKAADKCKASYFFSIGNKSSSDIWADHINETGKLSFTLHFRNRQKDGKEKSYNFSILELGNFSVENIMAASLMALDASCDPEDFPLALKDCRIPGRLEILKSRHENIKVVIDFAHNGLSFSALIKGLDAKYPDHKKILIFGSAGNKGINRRYDMGRVAAKEADEVILTSDDPAFEEVSDINKMIAKGLGDKDYKEIEDRQEAIIYGLESAKKMVKDNNKVLLLILGKGDDKDMPVKGVYLPYKGDGIIAGEWLKENKDI